MDTIRQIKIAYKIIEFYQKNDRLPNYHSQNLHETNLARHMQKFMTADKNNSDNYIEARNIINGFFSVN